MRLKELDGIRGLAAAQVMFAHIFTHFVAASNGSLANPVLSAIDTATTGASAVILFFVLSGLALSLPYFDRRRMHLPDFYVRRVFRIYPAFLASLAIAFLALAAFPEALKAGDVTKQWGSTGIAAPWGGWTLSNILRYAALIYPFTDYRTVLHHGAVWSLIIEMRISLILPFVIFIVALVRSAKLAIAALAFLLSMQFVEPKFSSPWLTILWNQIFWISIFLIGIITARHFDAVRRSLSRRYWPALLGIASITVYFLTPFAFDPTVDYLRFSVIVALAALGLMLSALSWPALGALLCRPVPQFLGTISYSLYLLHGPFFSLTNGLLMPRMPPLAALTIYVVATIGCAYLSTLFIEKPLIQAGHRLGATLRNSPPAPDGERRVRGA